MQLSQGPIAKLWDPTADGKAVGQQENAHSAAAADDRHGLVEPQSPVDVPKVGAVHCCLCIIEYFCQCCV